MSVTLQFQDSPHDLEVQESEFIRLLGYPSGHKLEGRPRELADWARHWYAENGRPWFFARRAGGVHVVGEQVLVADQQFSSERLATQFSAAEADDAMLVAVSAGCECEEKARECWLEEKPDEYFFLETFGSAVVEHLVTRVAGRICAWADQNGLAVLPHLSPGYTGWEISDQPRLWATISGYDGGLPGPLHVLETGMLRPKKSLLTVFGLTRHREKVPAGSRLIPCESCSLPRCQFRRAHYRFAMPQLETAAPQSHSKFIEPDPANHNSRANELPERYSINPRALAKWVDERLEVEFAADGGVVARFRYEGTTCSNFSRAILYDYHVRLAPPSQHCRILEMSCGPTADDPGNPFMCEYIKDPDGFMNRIASEKPFLNQPLAAVLEWKRAFNPAGCHCEAAARDYKWGIVLEVIHFALARSRKLPTKS